MTFAYTSCQFTSCKCLNSPLLSITTSILRLSCLCCFLTTNIAVARSALTKEKLHLILPNTAMLWLLIPCFATFDTKYLCPPVLGLLASHLEYSLWKLPNLRNWTLGMSLLHTHSHLKQQQWFPLI